MDIKMEPKTTEFLKGKTAHEVSQADMSLQDSIIRLVSITRIFQSCKMAPIISELTGS